MWADAESDETGPGDYDESDDEVWDEAEDRAYWRRRFLILCGGVAALGVCAWLFPGAHQPSPRAAAATRASMAALDKRQALPPAAYGNAWPAPKPPGEATPKAGPAVSPTALAKPASAANSVSIAAHPSPVASPPGGATGACSPAHIVLSLFTSQSSYAGDEWPRFSVYAVSTSTAACTMPYGAESVEVVVTRQGHVVWDSATCKSSAAKLVHFTLGVPQVLTMAWNPKAAEPEGCAGTLPSGASGTFDAVAMSDGQSSPVHAFTITRT